MNLKCKVFTDGPMSGLLKSDDGFETVCICPKELSFSNCKSK